MNAGIVGFGDGGKTNLRALNSIGIDVTAVCDPGTHSLDGVALYSTQSDFITHPDLDLVVIATPDDLHLDATRAALRCGHVFIEKPVATSHQDLMSFCRLVSDNPGKILFSEKYSYAPQIQAVLSQRNALGSFVSGTTRYVMSNCDRIMGDGKWRTQCAYNPCSGGLSHNFMTAVLLANSEIARIKASGQVKTYHELSEFGGYDMMDGVIEFRSGQMLGWEVDLSSKGLTAYGHRTVIHEFEFEHGSLLYHPKPADDELVVKGDRVSFIPEPQADGWAAYNESLYRLMHIDLMRSVQGGSSALHTIDQGINVALACCMAFQSAKTGGGWIDVA